MIEDLTKEKLIDYGFKSNMIDRLLTWDNYEVGHFENDFYCFWASNIEGKIYSEVEAQRKYFFRNGVIAFPFSGIALHSEYYQKSLSNYIEGKKKRLGNGIDEIEAIKKFIEYQKRITTNSIEELQKSKFKWDGLFLKIEVYEEFLNFLNKQLPAAQPPAKILEHSLKPMEQIELTEIKPVAIYTIEPIRKKQYLDRYISNNEIMSFYETILKQVNPQLSLQTRLKELPVIFSKFDWWDGIMKERLSFAPNKELAIELFKNELLGYVNYIDNESNLNEIEKEDNYAKKFRKITYDSVLRGDNFYLQEFGYLMLKNQYENIKNEKQFVGVVKIFDVGGVLEWLSEGAAIAEYVSTERYLLPFIEIQPPAKTFESKLTLEQLAKVFDLVTEIKLFKEPILQADLESISNSKASKTYEVTCNIHLAILFSCLSNEGFITKEWQSVIENNKCFKGKKSQKPMNANTIAGALQNIDRQSGIYKKINKVVVTLN